MEKLLMVDIRGVVIVEEHQQLINFLIHQTVVRFRDFEDGYVSTDAEVIIRRDLPHPLARRQGS